MRVRLAAAMVISALAAANAVAADTIKSGADAARGQKLASEVCAACHALGTDS